MNPHSLFNTLVGFRQSRFATASRWPAGMRMVLAAGCVAVFVGLAWARVELLTAMMP